MIASSQVIINKYAAVLAHPPCGNVYNVDDATGFGVGDTILVIQMKGASIDSSNTSAFGTILNYNGAGNYEFNVISGVSGNAITLRYNLSRQYDIPDGRVQFVRVPYFQNYTVSQTHSCMPWNGSKGGIIVLNASGSITLDAAIDVSARGFRNGVLMYANVAPCAQMAYYYPDVANSSGAEKGEGIAELSQNRMGGRGSLANGGGGGNSSNGGGAGGGNGGAGGHGGKETAIAVCAPAQQTGGLGGLALTYSNTLNKVFMGGGAGAGHANNNHGGNGNPGGGIVLLMANQLVSNNQSISADGGDGIGCAGDCWDGQPGGSAGGAVLLHANSFSGNVSVSAKGGKGGSHGANNTTYGANGPGGGGGGGVLWVSGSAIPPQITSTLTGGAKGVFLNNGDPWGTTDGSAGISLSGLAIGFPTDTFKGSSLNVSFKDSIVDCLTRAMIVLRPAYTQGFSYQWNLGNGTTSTLPSPVVTYAGVGTYTVTLTVTDANGCSGTFTKQVVVLPNPGFRMDTSICAGQSVRLNASGGSSYAWSPPTGLSSFTTASTVATPAVSTTYIVTINAGPNCVYRDTFVINVWPAAKAGFDFKPKPPIPNTPIQFYNMSSGASNYKWTFGDGGTSSENDPSHLYTRKGSYRVCLFASSGPGCADSVCKTVEADVKIAIGVPSAFSPNGDGANDVLYVRGGGVTSFNLKIYNRWGQKVFETNDFDKGWDGTYKGQIQDIEIFAYVLTAAFIDGSNTTQKGNISLVK